MRTCTALVMATMRQMHYCRLNRAYCADDAPLAVASGVLTTGASLVTGEGALAVAATLALFAAALVPGVPPGPAELLITPLLPELRASLPASSAFLQPGVALTNPEIAAINSIVLTLSFMTNLRIGEHFSAPQCGARTVSEAVRLRGRTPPPCVHRLASIVLPRGASATFRSAACGTQSPASYAMD